ncbi:hypothetical protein Pcinc_000404 [Petrolisthes cinctipes]|uniref:Uncharacterized protein n=1 Tax=Petrolisthes cinctipes TaxID=88211 RepID=A0AAE1BGB3_PETCI|nr:hypothetical protein Pcinc_043601 [Petrolisthes cinctipes]KAK3858425.1 hypothetical protein Pcinc_035387 [Petrolisthes cinctipes]KAK3895904.1 hypothetical protein Pcinc_000404 [Petrolisthes cinctipes]
MIREFPSLLPALLPAAATKERPQLITFEFSDSSQADYFILPAQLHITSEGLHPVLHSMEEIKKSLLAVLPDLDSALLNEVVDHLVKEVGVKVPEDFKFIDYDDLPMCFVGINPDKGTKAEKKKNRAHHTPVHLKVLGLINTFADLQWRR